MFSMNGAAQNLTAIRDYLKTHAPFLSDREDVSSGSTSLDSLLMGGFPKGSLTVVTGDLGTGRMTLVAHALREMTQQGRPVAWVDGEGTLYPPALSAQGVDLQRMLVVRKAKERSVYALEQIIESGFFSAVAASGIDRLLNPSRLRRIQTATEGARVCTLLVLDPSAAQQVTTAALKLRLTRRHRGIQVVVEKDRTGRAIGRRGFLPEDERMFGRPRSEPEQGPNKVPA
ncbi:MAG: hypothetical protein AAFN74_00085 [Myxococcota bacterium]